MEFKSEYTVEETIAMKKEFLRLKDKIYLDHAGATLYADSQIHAVSECLRENLFCNPHTSRTTEDLIDQVRYRVLKHFNTRSSNYEVIFTSGATASLKMVAESFNFDDGEGSFMYLRGCHTSVLGMRAVVRTQRIYPINRYQLLENSGMNRSPANGKSSLLVFPAQCNFNGEKYPLDLIEKIQSNGLSGHDTERLHVCLDAASLAATSFLDLDKYQPHFVCISFYKIFGFPTGLGALLVHRNAENLLQKRYYGGGTVKIAMSGQNFHVQRDGLAERFEDGTIPFTSIISLLHGFEAIQRLVPATAFQRSIERISRHTFNLGKYCYERLKSLRHKNGSNVVRLYHDTNYEDRTYQGAIVNFNVLHDDGSFVGFAEISHLAMIHDIVLRTGCFCNPGACQRFLQLTDADVLRHFDAGHICGDANDLIDGQPSGSVRVSFGYMSKKEDVERLVDMLDKCYIRKTVSNGITRPQIISQYKTHHDAKLRIICLFPIKSCGAFKIRTNWPISHKGLKYDREFVIVDENGVALTQKKNSEMCLIRPSIDLDNNEMTLSHPSMENFKMSLGVIAENNHSRVQLCQTKVCQDNVHAIDCGDDVSEWISIALQTSGLRLLKQSDDEVRTLPESSKEIALSNQAQFLLINQNSVRWLADMVPDWDDLGTEPSLESLVDRFRGNLIIESTKSFEENLWKRVRVGMLEFTVDGPCSRCQMICIDQGSGIKTTEPLRTIAREFKGKMKFGIYLTHVGASDRNQILHCGSTVNGLLE